MDGEEEAIPLDEEMEGEFDSTAELLFFRIGEAVPLKPSDSGYDLKDPPKRPLTVSERFGMLFVGHSEGFFVAKTRSVISLAKEIREAVEMEKENGVKQGQTCPSVQTASILDVRIGKVSILALSMDSSTLAATVGAEIHLFSVPLLAQKSGDPFLSCSPGKSGSIKDFQWCKGSVNSFTVLCGSLFHGNIDGDLKEVMDNVDAVDWNMDGSLLAVSRHGFLTILSWKFETLVVMDLLLESKGVDTDLECRMKVDSVKWATRNAIIIGCMQLDENDNGNDYLVQIILSEGGFEACSKPVVFSFTDLFHGMCDQVYGGGPQLFLSYLERWGIAVLANRSNMDDHIVLLELHVDNENKKAVALELEQEKHTPRIELQENGDENFILGLDFDKASLYENVSLIKGEETVEVSPYCILFCLTSEGKIVLFHVARSSDPPSTLPASLVVVDRTNVLEDISSVVLSTPDEPPMVNPFLKNDKPVYSFAKLEQSEQNFSIIQLNKDNKGLALSTDVSSMASQATVTASLGIPINRAHDSPFSGFSGAQSSVLGPVSGVPSKQGIVQSLGNLGKPSIQGYTGAHTSKVTDTSSSQPSSVSSSVGIKLPNTGDFIRSNDASIKGTGSGIYQEQPLGSTLSGNIFSVSGTAIFSSMTSSSGMSSSVDAKGHGGLRAQFSSSHSFMINQSVGSKLSFAVKEDPSQGKLIGGSSLPENHPSYIVSQTSNSSELSGHLYNVMNMVKELDRLLLEIEKKGGFSDMCTSYLRNSVIVLEKGLEGLSEKSRISKGAIAGLVAKVQHLQDKMVQVSAREGYMQGVVKQASNNQYWDIWNRQKLGPEFELKQKQISKINQGLRTQLLELERHFNVLEVNRFGESSETLKGRRTRSTSESLRRIQTIHRLYNTVVSQLSVAERLSDSLVEQMAVLKIDSPSAKKQNITRELLESIGVTCQESFESPDIKGTPLSSVSSAKYPLSMLGAFKEPARKSKSNKLKGIESETGRRRRDSLDKSLARFEPQKTTVKRMLQQEHSISSAGIFSKAIEETNCAKDVESLVLQKRAGENSMAPSFQPFISKSGHSNIQAGREYQEDFPKRGSSVQSGYTSKRIEDLSGFSQSAAEFRNWRSPETQVSQTCNFLSGSTSVPSTMSHVRDKKTETTISAGTLSFKAPYTGLPNQSTSATSVIKVSSNEEKKSVINLQPFLSFVPPVKFNPPKAEEKIQPGLPSSGNDGRGNLLSSTITVNLNHDAPIFGCSSPLVTSDKGSSIKENVFTSKSVPIDASVVSQYPVVSAPVRADSASPSLGSLSAVVPTQSKLTNVDLHDRDAKQFNASVPVSSIFSSPVSLSSQVSQPSPPSPPIAMPESSVSQLATTSPPFSTPLAAAASERKIGPLGSTVLSFSSASSSSTVTFTFPAPSSSSLSVASSAASLLSGITMKENDNNYNLEESQEDKMEEEAPDTSNVLSLGSFGGFGLGSTPVQSAPKPNPFGGSFASASPSSSSFSTSTFPGQIFKPASFTIPSLQQAPSPQPSSSVVSGGFSGFGQPAQVGVGQQALGSVLGSFGQTRQLGSVQGFGFSAGGFSGASAATSSGSGFSSTSGFAGAATGGGGFVGAGTGGGFGAVGSGGMGFASAGTGGGFGGSGSGAGGFAGAATGSGGFAGAATGGGGFTGVSGGGGFAGGGFASLGSGSGGFSGVASGTGFGGAPTGGFGGAPSTGGFGGTSSGGFGSASGAGKPPVELLMKMRK